MSISEIWAALTALHPGILAAAAAAIVLAAVVLIWMLAVRRYIGREPEERLIKRFNRTPSRRLAIRILASAPERGLFSVFRAALSRRRIAAALLEWIGSSDDFFVFRRIALSGKGEDFDGTRAAGLFEDKLDRIRELTGDPEWPARYMAVKILLSDSDERSRRSVRELFHDSHTLIRKTLAASFEPSDEKERSEFYDLLVSYLTDDTAFEVRRAARKRLKDDFPQRYSIDFSSLSSAQSLHVVEQFDTGSVEDRSRALELLELKDLEIRFTAAQFLQRGNFLDPLFLDASYDDRKQLERSEKLLRNAVGVNVSGFLENIILTSNPASLSIAASILQKNGNPELIAVLVEKVLDHIGVDTGSADETALFNAAMECVRNRGTEKAVQLVTGKLKERCAGSDEGARIMLDNLPSGFPHIVLPELLIILKEGICRFRESLHQAFLRYDASLYLDQLMGILKSEREAYAHEVRISALILLGKLNLAYCMQFLLEQMPVLPFEEARDFSLHLKEYAGKLFEQRVMETLEKDDGKVRAALICAVPATGVKEFLKPIRDAIGDADPEVRRAAVWALLEYGDQKSIRSSVDLLRDPVERVRIEAAHALGSGGSDSILESFSGILLDEHEVDTVKAAVIEGLSRSKSVKAVDIMVTLLKDSPDQFGERAMEGLAQFREARQIKRMIEKLKDADAELRERITGVFGRMGEDAEKPLLELLAEKISSLTPHITSVLEASGYVEHTIRKLNHRSPEVRRGAAETLSLIGTASAFRGIVMASRDPDQEVRVMVTKAIEQLGSKAGKDILEALKNDPDKRIRKYTLWALERIEAKKEL
jgi:HEAT repeat protein